ncbi:MAG TPA: hypothetical protein DDY31_12275, partial [Lachnospiraceae bacterium]|nr:hypothetical protein [Lachnospiraceae bacterium]
YLKYFSVRILPADKKAILLKELYSLQSLGRIAILYLSIIFFTPASTGLLLQMTEIYPRAK